MSLGVEGVICTTSDCSYPKAYAAVKTKKKSPHRPVHFGLEISVIYYEDEWLEQVPVAFSLPNPADAHERGCLLTVGDQQCILVATSP